MRYTELMESGGTSVRDLHLPDEFWTTLTVSEIDDLSRIDLSKRNITSLSGCPNEVNYDISVERNLLTSLVGAPKKIMGDFVCSRNKLLTSLIGGPEHVDGNYMVASCNIESLVGSPNYVGGDISCSYNDNLSSFEGAPKKIMGDFLCIANENITSLKDIHKQLPEIHGKLILSDCSITSHILGVFLIKGIKKLSIEFGGFMLMSSVNIVNQHIGKGRAGLLPCQAELIAAGLDDYAQI